MKGPRSMVGKANLPAAGAPPSFLGHAPQPLAGGGDFERVRIDDVHRLTRVEDVALHAEERAPAAIFMDVETRTRRILDEDPSLVIIHWSAPLRGRFGGIRLN